MKRFNNHKSNRALHTAAFAAAMIGAAASAHAGVLYTWNTFTAGSGTWNDGTQWTPAGGTSDPALYPGSNSAVIDDSATINPTAAGYGTFNINYTGMSAASISTLTLQGATGAASTDVLTFNATAPLTVTGNIVANATSNTTGPIVFNANSTISTAGVPAVGQVTINVNAGTFTSTGAFSGNATKLTINVLTGASASFGGITAGSSNSTVGGTINGNFSTTSYNTNSSADSGNLTIGNITNTINVNLGDIKLQRTSGTSTTPSATSNGLHIKGGTVTAGIFQIGISNSAAIAEISNGTLTVSSATFDVGQNTGGRRSAIFVDGGALIGSNAAGLVVGTSNAPNTSGGTGMLSITSGSATLEKLTLGGVQATTTTTSSNNVGNLSMTGGNLYLGSGGIIGTNATFASAATLGSTYNITLTGGTIGAKAAWSSAANMTVNTNAVTFQAADASNAPNDISLTGNLTGNGSLTKTGGGNLTLGGTASYTGATSVNTGTLLVTGAITASTASVAPGATLGGNGSITPAVTDSGTINPGATGAGSIGTLALGGGLTLADNATYAVDFNAASSDKLAVTGNIAFGNNETLAMNDLDATTNGSYVIATYTGTETGTFANLPANVTVDYTTGSAITVTIGTAAIPEPASLALLALAAPALLTRRRRI